MTSLKKIEILQTINAFLSIMSNFTSYRRIWRFALLPIIDFVSLFFGIWLVYSIRYNWFSQIFDGVKRLSLGDYLGFSALISASVLVVYAISGVYSITQKKTIFQNTFNLALGVFVVLISIITFFFFNEYNRVALPQGVPISRFVLAAGGFVALYFVYLGRLILWSLEQFLYTFGIGQSEVITIGDKKGFLKNELSKQNHIRSILELKDLDEKSFEQIQKKIIEGAISEVYVFVSKSKLAAELASLCERYKINFIFSPQGFSAFQAFDLNPIVIDKKLFLELVHSNLSGWNIVLKRIFDLLFSLSFLLLFSWLYLIIAIAIRIDSPGQIFYVSSRVGPNGKPFKLWKFRRLKQEFCTTENNLDALKVEEELIKSKDIRKDGVLYKIVNDPRSTRVGRFIEKYSLDELPQFFNVVLGNMSIVGPRPHQPREVAKYAQHHYKVLNIKPGITGLAQINGRSDLKFEQEVEYDTFYVENWSIWLDIYIILKTPLTIFWSRHQG